MVGTKELPRKRIVDCTKKMKSITKKAKELVARRDKMAKRVIQSVKKWQTKYILGMQNMESKNKEYMKEFSKQYEYCQKIKKRTPSNEDLINIGTILIDDKFDFDTSNLSKGEENFVKDLVKL
jgi:hypothetical protein